MGYTSRLSFVSASMVVVVVVVLVATAAVVVVGIDMSSLLHSQHGTGLCDDARQASELQCCLPNLVVTNSQKLPGYQGIGMKL